MDATLVERRFNERPRRVCDGVAAGLWRGPRTGGGEVFRALTRIFGALLPQFCHVWPMGQLLRLHRPPFPAASHPLQAAPRMRQDPAAAARGILLALALSSLLWIGLALLVPRLW